MPLPLAPAVILLGALRLAGEGRCPSILDVAVQVEQLGPEAQGREVHVRLDEEPGALRIRRLDAAGAVVEERLLPDGSCEDLALGAAVVIASWTTDLTGPVEPVVPSPPPLAPATVARESPPVRRPPDRPPVPPVESGSRAAWVDIAAAAVLSGALDVLAPGAALEVGFGSTRSCAGGRIALAVQGSRDLRLRPGMVSWSRDSVALGVGCRMQGERWFLHPHVDALAALLTLRGEGFAANHAAFTGDFGVASNARAGVRFGRTAMFIEIGNVIWLSGQRVTAIGSMTRMPVPSLEGLLSLGLAINVW